LEQKITIGILGKERTMAKDLLIFFLGFYIGLTILAVIAAQKDEE